MFCRISMYFIYGHTCCCAWLYHIYYTNDSFRSYVWGRIIRPYSVEEIPNIIIVVVWCCIVIAFVFCLSEIIHSSSERNKVWGFLSVARHRKSYCAIESVIRCTLNLTQLHPSLCGPRMQKTNDLPRGKAVIFKGSASIQKEFCLLQKFKQRLIISDRYSIKVPFFSDCLDDQYSHTLSLHHIRCVPIEERVSVSLLYLYTRLSRCAEKLFWFCPTDW